MANGKRHFSERNTQPNYQRETNSPSTMPKETKPYHVKQPDMTACNRTKPKGIIRAFTKTDQETSNTSENKKPKGIIRAAFTGQTTGAASNIKSSSEIDGQKLLKKWEDYLNGFVMLNEVYGEFSLDEIAAVAMCKVSKSDEASDSDGSFHGDKDAAPRGLVDYDDDSSNDSNSSSKVSTVEYIL